MASQEQSDDLPRDESGRFTEPHRHSFKKGVSGNPGGLPKGYVPVSKRLRNWLGSDEGWDDLKARLDALLEGGENGEVLKLLATAVGNDHALDKRDTSEGEDAPPPTVVLEEGRDAE